MHCRLSSETFAFLRLWVDCFFLRVLVVDCTQSISINHKPAASSSHLIYSAYSMSIWHCHYLCCQLRGKTATIPHSPPSNLYRTGKSNNPALNRLCRRGFRFPFVSECLYLKRSSVTLRCSLYCQICVSVACNRRASICMADWMAVRTIAHMWKAYCFEEVAVKEVRSRAQVRPVHMPCAGMQKGMMWLSLPWKF